MAAGSTLDERARAVVRGIDLAGPIERTAVAGDR
jgi:hypothetical protein